MDSARASDVEILVSSSSIVSCVYGSHKGPMSVIWEYIFWNIEVIASGEMMV